MGAGAAPRLVSALLLFVACCCTGAADASGAAAAEGGLAAQLAASVGSAAPPPVDPEAKYLFYDILEHEQLNKQRKGFMYALTVARALGRDLVLHRLRVRKYEKPDKAQHSLDHWKGRPPAFTHAFYPWRKFFNISLLSSGGGGGARGGGAATKTHEFDVLMHSHSAAAAAAAAVAGEGAGDIDADEAGDHNHNDYSNHNSVFMFDEVLYINKLLEGRRDMAGIHDVDCPVQGTFGTSPYQWTNQAITQDADAADADAADAATGGWVGQMYDFAGFRARSVRCVDIFGSLTHALSQSPYQSARSVVLLNAHFQMGYAYRENTRQIDRHYWPIRCYDCFPP